MLAWDTETALIRPAVLAPELACVSFSDGRRSEVVHARDARDALVWLLGQETVTANGAFDLAVVWSAFPDLRDQVWDAVLSGRVHDVIIRQKLIDIGEGKYRFIFKHIAGEKKKLNYSLSDLHARYFGSFMEKDEHRLGYGDLISKPLSEWPEGALSYAKYDALVTSRTFDEQVRATEHKPELLVDELPQVRAAWALQLLAARGVRTDPAQVRRVFEAIDAEQPLLKDYLMKVGLVRRDGTRKSKRARQLMFEVVGAAGELTDTGFDKVKAGELTREQALAQGYIKVDEEWCENSGDERLMKYDQYQQNQSLRTKLSNFMTGSLPLHTRYEVLLETGRTSSSEDRLLWNSAPLQNLPRKEGLRECIVAREGHSFIACDFGQAELVSLSQITYNWFEKDKVPGDSWYCESRMRQTLNEGRDVHVDFASDLLHIAYEEAWRRYEEGDPELKQFRQMAKPFNFGVPGGLSVESMVSYARKNYGVVLTKKEAKRLYDAWFRKFPEMRMYFRLIRKMFNPTFEDVFDESDLDQYGRFKFVTMRQEVSNRLRGGCRYTVACNTGFQGLTADAAKASLVEVARRCYTVPSSALYGSAPVLFVHDEVIVETPDDRLTEAARELETAMVQTYSTYTPDVRVTADAHAMKRWSKSAKEKKVNGRLVPWIDEKLEKTIAEYAMKRRAA